MTPMDGTPPALPSDLEDVAWALETAEALWKRGERVDAVVWVRRAAQAAGDGEDAKRAATLARLAAELGDWIGSHTITGEAIDGHLPSAGSIEAVDALLGEPGGAAGASSRDGSDVFVLSTNDVEVMSAKDFEAGFHAPPVPPKVPALPKIPDVKPASGGSHADGDVITVSLRAPDVEIIDDDHEEFLEDEDTPIIRHPRSPVPEANVPSAAQAHAGMLDPWTEAEAKKQAQRPSLSREEPEVLTFDDAEVVTSAKRNALQGPPANAAAEPIPRAPKAPRFPAPKARPPVAKMPEEVDTTTYRQINPRGSRGEAERAPQPPVAAKVDAPAAPKPAPPKGPLSRAKPSPPSEPEAPTRRAASPLADPAPPPRKKSDPPALDLLEMVDSVSITEEPVPEKPTRPASAPPPSAPHPSVAPTPRPAPSQAAPIPVSARPTAPPPSSIPLGAQPSGIPTLPRAGKTLLDLGAVEALTDLPDDAREAFGQAATIHTIANNEEVSRFALALVVDGEIDVSATIVDAPALRLAKNSILRSRGSIVPGVGLRLVCASEKALVATWDDAAVEVAFRTCPWVEEDLRAVADRVQAQAGVTMGPLGERFDLSLRDHLIGKLTVRNLSPGEVLVAEGKPTPIAVVGIGELVLTTKGKRGETLGPGDIVFPSQILAHAPAPATAAAGEAGAVVLFGDRAVAQELLMSFPPLLEVLATI